MKMFRAASLSALVILTLAFTIVLNASEANSNKCNADMTAHEMTATLYLGAVGAYLASKQPFECMPEKRSVTPLNE